ncbi:hypothetical protein [Aureispira anguillae]|uniref:Uncharacterized protein n=1 Tax=Aureispira anguillae TaxID=2864201 RepID=A0A915YG51_9BACT|nr:hypothetical protein [Aureispira anguillae]BDS12405.1 hypothetical protein AsAng_0031260 [Aureispira anguillae]
MLNIKQIIYYGDRLLWNQYLKQEYLTKITEVVTSNIEESPELEKIKMAAFNKQLDYNRGW